MPTGSTIAERVNAFPNWMYEIDLGEGVKTPIFRQDHVNRQNQRVRYWFEPLVRLNKGTLKGKRILDLGCSQGFWALQALNAGADFVLGVDGRAMSIDQAHLVMEARQMNTARYQFEVGNVFTWEASEQFDLVLCLGLMYHVARPLELLERCARWTQDMLVLDTNLCHLPGSSIQVRREETSDPRASVEYDLVMHPSYQAVLDLCQSVGFARTVALQPRFSSWEGCRDFQRGLRRAFFASRHTSLVGLDVDRNGLWVQARRAGRCIVAEFSRPIRKRLRG